MNVWVRTRKKAVTVLGTLALVLGGGTVVPGATAGAQTSCDATVGSGDSIQSAVDAAGPGETVCVGPGTYPEDVDIDKSLVLRSTDGRNATTIEGQRTGFTGAVRIDTGTSDVEVSGFTITTPARAALYIAADASGLRIAGNRLVAATGKSGLLTEGGQSDHVVEGNVFEGDAAQHAYVNGEASLGSANASSGVEFVGNAFVGASSVALGQEADDGVVRDNAFTGPSGWASLDLWGADNDVSANDFVGGNPLGGAHLRDNAGTLDLDAVLGANDFDRTVVVRDDPGGTFTAPAIFRWIGDALGVAGTGETVETSGDLFTEEVRIQTEGLHLLGADGARIEVDSDTVGGRNHRSAVAALADGVTIENFDIVRTVSAPDDPSGNTKAVGLRSTGTSLIGGSVTVDDQTGDDDSNSAVFIANNLVGFNPGNTPPLSGVTVQDVEIDPDQHGVAIVSLNELDDVAVSGTTISGGTGDGVLVATFGDADDPTNVSVADAVIFALRDGVVFGSGDGHQVVDSAIGEVRRGISVGSLSTTLEGNEIAESEVGIRLGEGAWTTGIFDSLIRDNGIGIEVTEDAGGEHGARDSRIEGNGVGVGNASAHEFDARENWWGAPTGPVLAPLGVGDSAEGDVLFTPWCGVPDCSVVLPPVS